MKLSITTKVPMSNGDPHVILLEGDTLTEIAEHFDAFLSPNAVEYMEFVHRKSDFGGNSLNRQGHTQYSKREHAIVDELLKQGVSKDRVEQLTGMGKVMVSRKYNSLGIGSSDS